MQFQITAHGLNLSVILLVVYCQATVVPPASSPNVSIFQPIYTRKDPRKYGYGKVFQRCRYKSFGINGARISLCKTYNDMYRQSTYKLGQMDRKTTKAFCQVFQGLLKSSIQASAPRGSPQHDFDMCCPTVPQMEKAPYRQKDVLGTYRDIIHLPALDLHQYYHSGICLEPKEDNYCHGTCIQATSTVYMAVFDFQSPVGFNFAPFTVPTYCSCRNIGNSPNRYFTKTIDKTKEGNQTDDIVQQGVSRVTEKVIDASTQSANENGETSPQKTSQNKKQPS